MPGAGHRLPPGKTRQGKAPGASSRRTRFPASGNSRSGNLRTFDLPRTGRRPQKHGETLLFSHTRPSTSPEPSLPIRRHVRKGAHRSRIIPHRARIRGRGSRIRKRGLRPSRTVSVRSPQGCVPFLRPVLTPPQAMRRTTEGKRSALRVFRAPALTPADPFPERKDAPPGAPLPQGRSAQAYQRGRMSRKARYAALHKRYARFAAACAPPSGGKRRPVPPA